MSLLRDIGHAFPLFDMGYSYWGDHGGGSPGDPSRNFLNVRYGSKTYAQDTQAALAQDKFDWFLQQYLPEYQKQAAQVGDEGYLNQQRDEARANVMHQAQNAAGSRERALRSFGLTPTAEQSAVWDKGDKLRAAAADVTAFNRTTDQVRDRDWMAMSGSRMSNYGGGT